MVIQLSFIVSLKKSVYINDIANNWVMSVEG